MRVRRCNLCTPDSIVWGFADGIIEIIIRARLFLQIEKKFLFSEKSYTLQFNGYLIHRAVDMFPAVFFAFFRLAPNSASMKYPSWNRWRTILYVFPFTGKAWLDLQNTRSLSPRCQRFHNQVPSPKSYLSIARSPIFCFFLISNFLSIVFRFFSSLTTSCDFSS